MGSLMKVSNGAEGNWMFSRFPSLFDDLFTRDFFNPVAAFGAMQTRPAVNIHETSSSFEFEVAAPGLDKKDFRVELSGNMLHISATHDSRTGQPHDPRQQSRSEFSYRSFSRSFTLPEGHADARNASARYENGILYVSVPKNEKMLPDTKEIRVS